MKKTQEIIGLPIISISDGMEVGKVKNIIINAEKGAIDYIVVDSGIQILNERVISTHNILGIGEYALTIENDGAINDLSKIPAAVDLLQKNVQVRGTKVLTKKGRLIGEIGDIFINEDENCSVVGLEFIADAIQKKISIIPRKNVITLGKNLTVVTEDIESALLDKPSDLTLELKVIIEQEKIQEDVQEIFEIETEVIEKSNVSFEPVVINSVETSELDNNALATEEPIISEPLTDFNASNVPVSENPIIENRVPEDTKQQSKAEEANSAADLFERRQKQYLRGRTATKTILDNDDNVIINEGDIITEVIVDIAKTRGKLVELVMNNKA